MQIAYLKRTPIEVNNQIIGETFSLIDGNNANETATLKARTLLAFLWGTGYVVTLDAPDWTIYYSPSLAGAAPTALGLLPILAEASEDTVAVMPVKYMEDSHKQYGTIAIRKGADIQRIFINSFLDSSRKWLQSHKRERRELETHFPTT